MEMFCSTAQQIANDLGYKIHITKVAVLREIQETRFLTRYEYVVNFTSESPEDDNKLFFPLALQMRKRFGGKYFLRHIRGVNGEYLTTEEWERLSQTKK